AIIMVSNIQLIQKFGRHGQVMFTIQDKILLADEYKVLDYIYRDSDGKAFAIDTVTNPLFNNTTWAFLFKWYGNEKYETMPVWLGYPQVDPFVYGKDIAFSDAALDKGSLLYVIYEPPEGIPDHYYSAYPRYEDTRSHLIEKKQIGTFWVEKRSLTGENMLFSRDALVDIME
nr:hypothetical protein [Candidatus Woesebacteria bacterium]